jgi:hypothetical protein
MAHYAYLDNNNVVVAVIVGKDETELIDGLDPEIYYAEGSQYRVKRTSYNGNIRKHYASIGMLYSDELDAFYYRQCHPQAILNEDAEWECDDEAHEEI